MNSKLKYISSSFILIALIVILALGFIYFSPRPPLTIDPETLSGDGSTLNY
ncbi:MAG: hypothetical protein ACI8Z1_002272, partial [Candidatus Azotimanducaceae bacterium]